MDPNTLSDVNIVGNAQACFKPKDHPTEVCSLTITDAKSGDTLEVKRVGDRYEPSAPPSSGKLKIPQSPLKDFVRLSRSFYKVFGDREQANAIVQKISIPHIKDEAAQQEFVFSNLDHIIDFVSHGKIKTKNPRMHALLTSTIQSSFFIFADPILGQLTVRNLEKLAKNKHLSPGSKKRIQFLLEVNRMRATIWSSTKKEQDLSHGLNRALKASITQIFIFLLTQENPSPARTKEMLFSEWILKAADIFQETHYGLKPDHHSLNNFYTYVANHLTKIHRDSNPKLLPNSFYPNLRTATQAYQTASHSEALAYLKRDQPKTAFFNSLILNYGSSALQKQVLKIIFQHTKLANIKDKPQLQFSFAKISEALKTWTLDQPKPEQARTAIAPVIQALFAPNKTMKVFWGAKMQSLANFAQAPGFRQSRDTSLVNELLLWSEGKPIAPLSIPDPDGDGEHSPFRPWALTAEGLVSTTGFLSAGLLPYVNADTEYYARGAHVILGASGAGAMVGNLTSYALDIDPDYAWVFDLGGAAVGGLLGGLIYGLATTKPEFSPLGDPGGTRFPVDPYGP